MKILIIIPDSMFDAGLPLIKQLQQFADVYCLFEVHAYANNLMNISLNDLSFRIITRAIEVEPMKRYSSFLPLDKSIVVSVSSPKNIKRIFKIQSEVKKYVSSLPIDLMYFFNVPSVIYLYTLYTCKIKWVTAVHDPILHSDQKSSLYYTLIRKLVFNKCNTFFLFNEALIADFVRTYHLEKKNVYVTRLGIYEHLNMYTKKESLASSNSTMKILFFGRIQKYKGIRYLLKAFKQIRDLGYDNVELIVAGSGSIEKDILDLENTPGLLIKNRFIPEEELACDIQDCDVVICPYTDATQSGVIMSAYAFCKPVIATNVGGLSEMVINNQTGLIIPPKSSDEIVNALLLLLKEPDLLTLWKNNIYNLYFEGKFSWRNIVHCLINTMSKL